MFQRTLDILSLSENRVVIKEVSAVNDTNAIHLFPPAFPLWFSIAFFMKKLIKLVQKLDKKSEIIDFKY